MHTLLILGGCYAAISALCTVTYASASWFFGTRECNRPAIAAAQRAQALARQDFVTTNMRRTP